MIIIKEIDTQYLDKIIPLVLQLDPDKSKETLQTRISEMMNYPNYFCFGIFQYDKLIGISGAWITTRIYSGKQVELDSVIIDQTIRSKGFGKKLIQHIESWSKEKGCISLELNTFVNNTKSHKFYYNLGAQILGYHFVKSIN